MPRVRWTVDFASTPIKGRVASPVRAVSAAKKNDSVRLEQVNGVFSIVICISPPHSQILRQRLLVAGGPRLTEDHSQLVPKTGKRGHVKTRRTRGQTHTPRICMFDGKVAQSILTSFAKWSRKEPGRLSFANCPSGWKLPPSPGLTVIARSAYGTASLSVPIRVTVPVTIVRDSFSRSTPCRHPNHQCFPARQSRNVAGSARSRHFCTVWKRQSYAPSPD